MTNWVFTTNHIHVLFKECQILHVSKITDQEIQSTKSCSSHTDLLVMVETNMLIKNTGNSRSKLINYLCYYEISSCVFHHYKHQCLFFHFIKPKG